MMGREWGSRGARRLVRRRDGAWRGRGEKGGGVAKVERFGGGVAQGGRGGVGGV